jgi:hypothetical protein
MQGIYTYILETNYVPREYSIAAILLLVCVCLEEEEEEGEEEEQEQEEYDPGKYGKRK